MKRIALSVVFAVLGAANSGCALLDALLVGAPACGGAPHGCTYAPGPIGTVGPIDSIGSIGPIAPRARIAHGGYGSDCAPCRGSRPVRDLVAWLSFWHHGHHGGLKCCGDPTGSCGKPFFWGWGCGERYCGDWYRGPKAACESCDRHGNWIGTPPLGGHPGSGQFAPRSQDNQMETMPQPAPTRRPPPPPQIKPMPTDEDDVLLPSDEIHHAPRRIQPVTPAPASRPQPKSVMRQPQVAPQAWQPRGATY